ncbi:hypothetical protein M405DRAFT_620602 [Rhizopogon salebrosus TDB-379]|nr:hypothetical protein M405DRAFT_620602 [Rhizopogon salebrosus TDB-379]
MWYVVVFTYIPSNTTLQVHWQSRCRVSFTSISNMICCQHLPCPSITHSCVLLPPLALAVYYSSTVFASISSPAWSTTSPSK